MKALTLLTALALTATAHAAEESWTDTSNRHAQVLLEVLAEYSPEYATSIGVEGHEAEVMDLRPEYVERQRADLEAAARRLEAQQAQAQDARVRQDLQILERAARDQSRTLALEQRLLLPYFDLTQAVFQGFQDLLDPRVAQERQRAALERLQRYTGAEPGYEPIAELARARIAERLDEPGLVGPWVVEVEQSLANQDVYLEGLRDLFAKSGLEGWQDGLATLERQLESYGEWVRREVLPRARATNRLPPEIYANNLRNFGVEMDPQVLIERALSAYVQTREELQALAALLARERGWESTDYREVIRELKREQIPNDELLPLYRRRLEALEEIVRGERIVSLPARAAVIRLATEAESAATPAPHVDPPRLIGNTGEPAEFVLPLANPNADSLAAMDDFTYDAITWTLTAHEARPGHELQFAAMLERGVSIPRVVFAFNSANVEGWALYAEALMKPYLPLEGQIGSLQMRLMRAARAFLDPMLNLGLIEPEAAKRLLMEEVVLSEPMAKQEVDRYTFRAPGQATAYFYGYDRLEMLRGRAEIALAERFDALAYHDFIVSQGLLPFDLLEKAVMDEFVAGRRASAPQSAPPAEAAAGATQ